MSESVVVESGGEQLPGDLYLPANGAAPSSGVVLCHASGTRWSTDENMATWLSDHGHSVLTFDWRGCVGNPSPRDLFPLRVAEDLIAGISFLASHPAIDPDRLGILGRGLGGGFALQAAATDERIRATICFSGFGDFSRRTALVSGVEHWEQLRRDARTGNGSGGIPTSRVLGSGGHTTSATEAPRPVKPFEFSMESVRALLAFKPEAVVSRIAPRALLVIHAAEDSMFPRSEAISIYAKASEPSELEFIDTTDHMEMYSGLNEKIYEETMSKCHAFLVRHLS